MEELWEVGIWKNTFPNIKLMGERKPGCLPQLWASLGDSINLGLYIKECRGPFGNLIHQAKKTILSLDGMAARVPGTRNLQLLAITWENRESGIGRRQ
jgi:hypothetical protein